LRGCSRPVSSDLAPGALPAGSESDGGLRVQVRAGRFELILTAAARLSSRLCPPREPGPAREEVVEFCFAANDRCASSAAVEGGRGIDPAQSECAGGLARVPRISVRMRRVLISGSSNHAAAVSPTRTRTGAPEASIWLYFDH